VWGYQSNLQSSMIPRYFIFETTFSRPVVIVEMLLYISLFLMNVGSSADFSLELLCICSLHRSSMVRSVLCTVVRIAGWEGPCIISNMSSAKVTVFMFGVLDIRTIRSLIMMFHRVGSETDPCGQPLVTRLALATSPSLMCA
jgi:hypothetical protein